VRVAGIAPVAAEAGTYCGNGKSGVERGMRAAWITPDAAEARPYNG
jgi:hypothetical protein